MAQRCWVRISLAWVTPSPTNDILHSCQGSCDRPQWRFLASTTTIRLSILAKVSDGEPSIGLTSATSTMSTPTLGNALNRVNSALPSCISQVMNSGAYFFTNWVSWPDEEIIAKAMPATTSTSPKREANVIPTILSVFYLTQIVLYWSTTKIGILVHAVICGFLHRSVFIGLSSNMNNCFRTGNNAKIHNFHYRTRFISETRKIGKFGRADMLFHYEQVELSNLGLSYGCRYQKSHEFHGAK